MHAAWGNRRDSFANSSPADAPSALPSLFGIAIVPRFSMSRPAEAFVSSFKIGVPFSGLESVFAAFSVLAFEDGSSPFDLAASCLVVVTVDPSDFGGGWLVSAFATVSVCGVPCFFAVSDDCGLLPSSTSVPLLLLGDASSKVALSFLSDSPVFPLVTVAVRIASLTFFRASDAAFTTPFTAAIEESFRIGSPPSSVAMDSFGSVLIEFWSSDIFTVSDTFSPYSRSSGVGLESPSMVPSFESCSFSSTWTSSVTAERSSSPPSFSLCALLSLEVSSEVSLMPPSDFLSLSLEPSLSVVELSFGAGFVVCLDSFVTSFSSAPT
mmetsp:Transcript_29576/g.50371  ORF Transcript_29576/g.50371 Transcript_29576/m.50371 type:complete len:323 (-) Transcript_29576:409-1377(-)